MVSKKRSKKSGTEKKILRPGLTPDEIVKRAIELADHRGIESVSMRNLAAELGVQAMSLYHHVRSRETLLDGMVDRVFEEFTLSIPGEGVPWKEWMVALSERMREVLLTHPWAVGLLDSRRNPGKATLFYQNGRLEYLRKSGFSIEMAGHAVALQDSFVYGFVMQELALPFRNEKEMEEVVEDIQTQMQKGEYPYLVEMIEQQVLKKGYSFAGEFHFGLGLILQGLESHMIQK